MNRMQDEIRIDLTAVVATEAINAARTEMRTLSTREIEAVAGGPEGEVGNGTVPPK